MSHNFGDLPIDDLILATGLTDDQITAAARLVRRLCGDDADLVLAVLGIGAP